LKQTLRTAILLSFACAALTALSNFAQAQKIDVAFGISTVTAPPASDANGVDHLPVSLTGGTYPGISGDVLLFHHVGLQGELYWKGSRGDYGNTGLPYRPLFYDVNAIYAPKLASHTYLELLGGIGALSTRFYCPSICNFQGTNYQDSNHFMGHFGTGIKFYPAGNFFIRPEAHLYLVNNNLEYSSPRVVRYGLSLGYTFGGK
jgi:hypothetical protein